MRGFGQTSIFMFLYLYSRFILQSVLALGFLVSGLEVCFFRIFNLITTIFSIFCVDRARSNRSGARFSSSFFFFSSVWSGSLTDATGVDKIGALYARTRSPRYTEAAAKHVSARLSRLVAVIFPSLLACGGFYQGVLTGRSHLASRAVTVIFSDA